MQEFLHVRTTLSVPLVQRHIFKPIFLSTSLKIQQVTNHWKGYGHERISDKQQQAISCIMMSGQYTSYSTELENMSKDTGYSVTKSTATASSCEISLGRVFGDLSIKSCSIGQITLLIQPSNIMTKTIVSLTIKIVKNMEWDIV